MSEQSINASVRDPDEATFPSSSDSLEPASGITIMIATHNRAEVLRTTLEAMCALDRRQIDAEWVVIDNNSSDNTREVAELYASRLKLVYLFEANPGKNHALNKALKSVQLNEIVVFTDDDVTPSADWLQQIALSCRRHPDFQVFGGRIRVKWPEDRMPAWAASKFVQAFGFSMHDMGNESMVYPKGVFPFGPNFWVRRKIFEKGLFYDTRVGPRPKNRIMGSETTFLKALENHGFQRLYWPNASVDHRIEQSACTPKMVRRRAFRLGRSDVYTGALPPKRVLVRQEWMWQPYLLYKIMTSSVRWTLSWLIPGQERRLLAAVSSLRMIGRMYEARRQGKSH